MLAALSLIDLTHLCDLAGESLTQRCYILFILCLLLSKVFVYLALLFPQVGNAPLGSVNLFKKKLITFGLK